MKKLSCWQRFKARKANKLKSVAEPDEKPNASNKAPHDVNSSVLEDLADKVPEPLAGEENESSRRELLEDQS